MIYSINNNTFHRVEERDVELKDAELKDVELKDAELKDVENPVENPKNTVELDTVKDNILILISVLRYYIKLIIDDRSIYRN